MHSYYTPDASLSILEALQAAAATKSDPKPALRRLPYWGAAVLADEIEAVFSQAAALANVGFPLTPSQMHILTTAENCDHLYEGLTQLT